MYHKMHQRNRPRIPGLVVIMLFLLIFAGLSSFLSKKTDKKVSMSETKVERAEITNIRDSTITIFWRTAEPAESYIMYGPSQSDIGKKAIDKRDTESLLTARRNHVAVIEQ